MNPDLQPYLLTIMSRFALCVIAASLSSGCASWTNPVANGIPVRMLDEELLAEPKEELEDIPWGLLQRKLIPSEERLIEPRDVLGVYIVGALGFEQQQPPFLLPTAADVPPAMGFPIPVRADGTIPLPIIEDPKVAGMTVEEAEAKIINLYEEHQEILMPHLTKIVTMIRPRHVRVLVVREDTLGSRGQRFIQSARGFLATPLSRTSTSGQGAGFELELPAYQADVLTALSNTGGLPGLDAEDEILIYRNRANPEGIDVAELDREGLEPDRIPLKVKKGERVEISEEKITLYDNDIVVVTTREPEHYYTGGLMFNQEVPLPFDYDLTVVQAVIRGGGPLMNGGFGGANLNGNIVNTGIGNPSPSLLTVLRQMPNGMQVPIRVDLNEALRDPRENIVVQNGDLLVLQETTGESFTRYLSNIFNFSGSAAVNRVNGVSTRSSALGGSVGPLP